MGCATVSADGESGRWVPSDRFFGWLRCCDGERVCDLDVLHSGFGWPEAGDEVLDVVASEVRLGHRLRSRRGKPPIHRRLPR